MSRELFLVYTAGPGVTETQHDAYFGACAGLLPKISHWWCQGGSGNSETGEWTVWISATKAKAFYRIKPALDTYFGVQGTLTLPDWSTE